MMKTTAALLATIVGVNADCYLHNPRGSNNRLDEANRDRNNGNRMFDSQNNNRGGYNVGQVYFYEDTMVPMEWTNQHSCGNPNNNCEIIIQYMCDDRLRDGTTTNTIPTNSLDCYGWDCDTDVRYGRHESWDYYMNCANRERNKGLFTADQKPNGNQAIYTRQNPNGGRRGLECPEERDYYPYWGPTPWRDIAILTNQPQRCQAYAAESQNVKPRHYCDLPYTARKWSGMPIPIQREACETYQYYDETLNSTITGAWRSRAAFGVAAPICRDNQWGRDNHLGNVGGGRNAGFNWTVPSDWIHEGCALRVRYNISTGDMPHFDSKSTLKSQTLNASQNGEGKSNKNNGDTLPVMAKEIGVETYGMATVEEANTRQYWLEGNPDVDLFGGMLTPAGVIKLQLAINTAQFGRTFQDRTHKFAIRKRPSEFEGAVVHNIQVRGKRGNIVQTYPGTEYDFAPNMMHCRKGDMVHFQWTGSNTNPNNNAGQGKAGTDRHNAIVLRGTNFPEVGQDENDSFDKTYGHYGNSYPSTINAKFLGFSKTDKRALAVLDNMQFGGEMSELDDAGTYFDLGPRACSQNGVYHYMSTRNNNFTNRSQKARIVVSDIAMQSLLVGLNGGAINLDGSSVEISANSLVTPQTIVVSTYPSDYKSTFEEQEGGAASNFVQVTVQNTEGNKFALKKGQKVDLTIKYESDAVGYATMWRSDTLDGEWEEIEDAEFAEESGETSITKGGVYVVSTTPNVVAIVFITIAVLAALGAIGYFLVKKFRGNDLSAMRGV
jgi:hypothetical protein